MAACGGSGGVGDLKGAGSSMGGGEAGEALHFLEGRGEGEDIGGVCCRRKNGSLYRPKFFVFFLDSNFFLSQSWEPDRGYTTRLYKFTDRPFLLYPFDYDPALNQVLV